jgi:hypothetical protein
MAEHAPCREEASLGGQSMKRRTNVESSAAAAAARGAAAGVIGGIALIAVDRLVAPRLGGDRREREWDDLVADGLARTGVRLSGRERTAAGIASGLAYAMVLGAAYGVARWRYQSSPATLHLLDAALVYGASLVSREPRPARRGARRPAVRAIRAVSSASLFGQATAAAYKALSRRAG